jgi:hypothetical protein
MLLQVLKDILIKEGRTPTLFDLGSSKGRPSVCTFYNHFETFTEALQCIGINTPNAKMGNRYDKEGIIQKLKDVAVRTGRDPVVSDFRGVDGEPSIQTYRNYHQKFSIAKKLAGFNIDNTAVARGRRAEIEVLKSFEKEGAIDIAGEDHLNPIDGLDPNKQPYNVKSARLLNGVYPFRDFKHHSITKLYILMGYGDGEDENVLQHKWIIPSEVINNRRCLDISESKHSLIRWSKYEVSI